MTGPVAPRDPEKARAHFWKRDLRTEAGRWQSSAVHL